MERIVVPSSVKSLGAFTFEDCTQLIAVELCMGLNQICEGAFRYCRSLERISVPSSVEEIGRDAFRGCVLLTNVDICEGLERIELMAFEGCTSIARINIPTSVMAIKKGAFSNCPSLVVIVFCEEIEDLVTESSLTDWYDHGRKEGWHRVYSLLKSYSILERLGRIQHRRKSRNDIHDMLRRFPAINDYKYEEHCRLIQRRLDRYIALKEPASLLELALWKSKFAEQQSDLNSTNYSALRSEARTSCGATVIIPNVLSFLVGVDSEDDIEYCENKFRRMNHGELDDQLMYAYSMYEYDENDYYTDQYEYDEYDYFMDQYDAHQYSYYKED